MQSCRGDGANLAGYVDCPGLANNLASLIVGDNLSTINNIAVLEQRVRYATKAVINLALDFIHLGGLHDAALTHEVPVIIFCPIKPVVIPTNLQSYFLFRQSAHFLLLIWAKQIPWFHARSKI